MTQGPPPDPYVEAKLLGIMLSGIFAQTREDCSARAPLRVELKPSGTYRISARGVENTLTEGSAISIDLRGPESR